MGLLDKLKQALASKPAAPALPSGADQKFAAIITASRIAWARDQNYFYNVKVDKLAEWALVKEWPDAERVDFMVYCVKSVYAYNKDRTTWSTGSVEHNDNEVCQSYLQHLLRIKLAMSDADIQRVHQAFVKCPRWSVNGYRWWPIGLFLAQVERQLKSRPLTDELRTTLLDVQQKLGSPAERAKDKETSKLAAKVDEIIFHSGNEKDAVKPVTIEGNDGFTEFANQHLATLPEEERTHWYRLIAHARKASGAKPSEKYLDAAKDLIDALGADRFKITVCAWLEHLARMKEVIQEHRSEYQGRVYIHSTYTYLAGINMDMVKGLAWMCAHFHNARTIAAVAALAERSFRKIPGQGPAAAAVGNACLFTLFRSKGLDGIGQLSRLKLRIKQSSTVALIDKYLTEAAENKGISVHEIEDLACDDHDLKLGVRTWDFDGYTANLTVTGPGRSELAWTKPDGSPQKSVPAVVKEKHAAKLKKLKDTVKQVDLSTTAQRDRLDRMFRSQRLMPLPYFREHFVDHGLLAFLTHRIIWNLHRGEAVVQAIRINGAWTTRTGEAFTPAEDMTVSLWHPATATVAEVSAWREFMMDREIRQPLKQAFREVYLLTDAEVKTRTYSNRMAAHLLKQHQFNSLAKTRGWKYALQGAFDNGRDGEVASISLPDYGIGAQFWVNEVNADDAMNDTGIWTYVATDQLRFGRIGSEDPMDLVDVPVVAFSEVMRDVDLFVGVASVGNDPQWEDSGGVAAFRGYWQSYSFGDLGEVAKTRKEILTRLLPRLKIAPIASIQDKFLVVKGKLRTYKIHMGSTNILMEPNDQYLCIVPDRSKGPASPNIFLPFEGDSGLSVIISKAFLLAEDDKIKDSTITSQINKR